MDNIDFNKLLNEKCGIDSSGYDTIQVIGANSAQEAAYHLGQCKVNYDPNPIIIKKRDTRAPVEYKQKVFIRYLKPPNAPAPGPLIIKEQRPPQQKPLPPLIVKQRPKRQKTPPPIILREAPPGELLQNQPRFIPATGQKLSAEEYNQVRMAMAAGSNSTQLNSTVNSFGQNDMGQTNSYANNPGVEMNDLDEDLQRLLTSGHLHP